MAYPLGRVGIEIESENVYQTQINAVMDRNTWTIDHDASVESIAYAVRGMIFRELPRGANIGYDQVTLGTELVIRNPLNIDDSTGNLKKLAAITEALQMCGEKEQNFRSGVHFHISMPNSLPILKSMVRLGRHFEDLFFYVGTQGYTFRGMVANKSAYCRPITNEGPQCVPTTNGSRMAQIFDIDDLIGAKTFEGFWNRCGNINPEMPVPRYHPSRYCWLNWYSLLAHGSLEFRIFNTTLNPWFLFCDMQLCNAFCNLAMNMTYNPDFKPKLEDGSIYLGRGKNAILNSLDLLRLPDNIAQTLADVVERAPAVEIKPGLVRSHLRNLGEYNMSGMGVKYYDRSDTEDIIVDDIHHRRGER